MSMYTNLRQLDYAEVVRRLQYWVSHYDHPQARTAITLLVDALHKHEDNLYFKIKPVTLFQEDKDVDRHLRVLEDLEGVHHD